MRKADIEPAKGAARRASAASAVSVGLPPLEAMFNGNGTAYAQAAPAFRNVSGSSSGATG